jgi:predicted component of type VI protein secretion system
VTDQTYEAMSPAEVEAKLRFITQEMGRAQLDLRAARQAELEAKVAYQAAHRAAMLSPDRPRVARGAFTVAELAAWVEEQCATEETAYETAKVTRQSAADYLHTVEEQGKFVQSINKSVDTAYRMPDRWQR